MVSGSAWKDPSVARNFVDERRRAIPFGEEQLQVMLEVVHHFRPAPTRIIDLGCGDGILARLLLDRYPAASAVLVDHSPPMLERAREAMAAYGDRCEIRQGDLGAPIVELCGGLADIVVSGYAIHHLPHERKRSLYGEIYDRLSPSGLFVNVEHVASATRELEILFEERYIDHIAACTGKLREAVAAAYHGRLDKADNILAPLEQQLGWLREIGFGQVDCYFKWAVLAVFGGVRP